MIVKNPSKLILILCPNPAIDSYAWLHKFEFGKSNRIERLQLYPGGKGIHVALALKVLGGTAKLMANWAGETGEWIKQKLHDQNIKISGIQLKGNNRKCYTFRSLNTSFNCTELLEPGPAVSKVNWINLKKSFLREISDTEIICMSGSWPINAPLDAYSQLIKIANHYKKKVFLDATGEQLEKALELGFFGLHLNESEAIKFCGSSKFSSILRKLDNKVEMVALTKGKDGLFLYYEGKIIEANVEIDHVISPVGSGDCLMAGIVWAFDQEKTMAEIAAYGVACGAANCLTEELGMLRKEDVTKLLKKVVYKNSNNER